MTRPTNTTDGGWLLDLPNRSVAAGSPLVVEANRSLGGVSIQAARVEEHEDIWALSAEMEADPGQANVGRCQAVGDQPPGLYWLTGLDINNGPQIATTHVMMQPRLLFEVRAVTDQARSLEDLEAAYGEVVRRRQERREAGIGSGQVAATVLVFVKDLLTTTVLNLVSCEIVPLEPVGWTAEVQAVDRFLEARGAPPLRWTQQVLDQVRRAEPATLIQFPVVRADTLRQCGELAMREASLLAMLLAAHRGSFGDVFCTIIHEPQTGQLLSGLHIPPYRGNLIGGFISGEEPEGLRRSLHAIRDDPTLQLIVLLLGEATRERRADFQYVRLWSLLETVARGRGCAGRPKCDWSGQIRVGKKGQSLFVQEAAEQVYELLRELLAPSGLGEQAFASGLTSGALQEQISIWYRRRNCTAHGDPDCVCRDPSKVGAASAKYATCYRARSDDQNGQDGYLRTLREVAKSVVFAMLRERWPTLLPWRVLYRGPDFFWQSPERPATEPTNVPRSLLRWVPADGVRVEEQARDQDDAARAELDVLRLDLRIPISVVGIPVQRFGAPRTLVAGRPLIGMTRSSHTSRAAWSVPIDWCPQADR